MSLSKYQVGMIYRTSGIGDVEIEATENHLIIAGINEVIRVDWAETAGYAWFDHMTKVMEAAVLPGALAYCPNVKDWTLFPSLIRITHVYTFMKAIPALQHAFRDGMELHWMANGINEIELSRATSRACWTAILHHLNNNLNTNRRHLVMLEG